MLPLGTIVKLKEDDGLVMIIKRVSLSPSPKTGEVGYFEYKACDYPVGYNDEDDNSIFNEEDIEEVVHLGYESDIDKQYIENLKQYIEDKKLPKVTFEEIEQAQEEEDTNPFRKLFNFNKK